MRTATATVTATQSPTMTLTKTSDVTTVSSVGQNVRYTFTATNTGNVDLTGVRIADPHVAAITCTPAAGSTLAPRATMSCTADYVTTQADLDAGSILNTATVTGTSPAGVEASATASRTVSVTQTATLALTKSANPTNVTSVGQVVTYSFVARNTGNTTLSDVQVTDPLTGLSALTCTPALGSALAPQATMSCTATRATTQADLDAGSRANTATVTGTGPGGTTATTTANTTVQATQSPSLAFAKVADRTTYSAVGDVATYTITARNTGNVTLRQVNVSDSMPDVANWSCDPAGPAELAPGAVKTCTGTHTITQADLDTGTVVNDAQVTAQDPAGTALPAQHASVTLAATQSPSLSFSKSASPTTVSAVGQIVTYTFTTTNTGNVSLGNVVVSDTISGLSPLSCGALTGPVSLAPGQTKTCTATRAVTQTDLNAGSIVNAAEVRGDRPGGNTADPSDDITAADSVPVTATQTPALALTKTSDVSSVSAVGQRVHFTTTARNTGNVDLTNVRLEDQLTGIGALTCTPALGSTLAPQATMTCGADYLATQADLDRGSIVNDAVVNGTAPSGAGVTAAATRTVTVAQTSTISLVKAASPTTVTAVDQVVTYSFTVRNTGNVTLSDVGVNETLAGVSTPSCTPAVGSSLAPGATMTCSATRATTQADLNAGAVTNSATATGTNPAGTAVTSTPAAATVQATQSPALTLDKTADRTTFSAVGDVITYTIVATNSGNVTVATSRSATPWPASPRSAASLRPRPASTPGRA